MPSIYNAPYMTGADRNQWASWISSVIYPASFAIPNCFCSYLMINPVKYSWQEEIILTGNFATVKRRKIQRIWQVNALT